VRRPTPLPAPPRRTVDAAAEPAGNATASSPGQAQVDSAADDPRHAATPPVDAYAPDESAFPDISRTAREPAPVIPLTRATAEDTDDIARAIEADHSVDADAGEPEDTDARPMTARDVWAAARARRKALRAEVRRFTVRQRRRRMVWIGSAAAVVLLVLGTLAAAYSPLFALRHIEVVGTSMLDAAVVEQALDGQLGTPLPLVDSSEVKAALVGFPLVETYTLEARPPHDLVVRIVERTPIGTIESAAGFTLVDAAGVALSTTEKRPDGYPVLSVTGGVASRAFTAVGTVFRSLPDEVRDQVTKITATTANDVTLTLADPKTTVVWGTADDSAYKAVVLAAAMEAAPGKSHYDVSAPNAVVSR